MMCIDTITTGSKDTGGNWTKTHGRPQNKICALMLKSITARSDLRPQSIRPRHNTCDGLYPDRQIYGLILKKAIFISVHDNLCQVHQRVFSVHQRNPAHIPVVDLPQALSRTVNSMPGQFTSVTAEAIMAENVKKYSIYLVNRKV